MKVVTVSRILGRHKGEAAMLLCDAEMVGRAFGAVKSIAGALGLATESLTQHSESAISTVLETVLDNMESPAFDLLSDFRDSYTAPRNRVVEIQLTDKATQTTQTFCIIPSLTREGSATVRVSRLDVKVLP